MSESYAFTVGLVCLIETGKNPVFHAMYDPEEAARMQRVGVAAMKIAERINQMNLSDQKRSELINDLIMSASNLWRAGESEELVATDPDAWIMERLL